MPKNQQRGLIRGDMIGLLMGAVALGGLLLYGGLSGQPLPLWPALLVIAVNVVAAIRVALGVLKAKRLRQSAELSANTPPPP